MRKHDVRKWLHAVLDLLPVILIPVFMIYSHRHTIDSGFIDVPQNQVVDFNQNIHNGNFSSFDYWNLGLNVSDAEIVDEQGLLITSTGSDNTYLLQTDLSFINGHYYYFKFDVRLSDNVSSSYAFSRVGDFAFSYFSDDSVSSVYKTFGNRYLFSGNDGYYTYQVGLRNSDSYSMTYYIDNVMLFDLTRLFGSGNEPTINQFNQWYTNVYYDYTLSHKELLKGTSTITYQDTDIMSQVVYQLYNSVDKYFNMGNVFNMNGVYDWFNLNIFNGNAPISIYIVWNIVLYEFVMDLLFLLYGLFMWFIDMVEKLMEKPLKSVK